MFDSAQWVHKNMPIGSGTKQMWWSSTFSFPCYSPSGLSYEDTYNTLKYADRAMNITCKVVRNEMSVDMHVSRYAKIVEELRAEVNWIQLKNL